MSGPDNVRDENRPESGPFPIADFTPEPTRDLARWRWLWKEDVPFPIRSHRGFLGGLLVLWKKLLRPLVRTPQNDLWERQRIFNVVLIERLQGLETLVEQFQRRVEHAEHLTQKGFTELTRHHDALFAVLDQKIDAYRRRNEFFNHSLGAALARVETVERGGAPAMDVAPLVERRNEVGYLALEARYRGSEEDIRERLRLYLPRLAGKGPVLDLGCGRGEMLSLLEEQGIAARGVDGSEQMVEACRARGVEAERGDLFAALTAVPPASLGAVVSFHVIEHLPPASLDRLVRLAWSALRPGGVLILETPSPLALAAGARNFWLDPTHQRPVHPESLRLSFELAGFDPVERLDLRPFPEGEQLPELELAAFPAEQRELVDQVNRLRDRLNDLLYGAQDFALIGTKR
jgi:SAM-dependent methyltransferase